MVFFETHSTSIDNEAGIASGHRDVPLSSTGRRQAEELGRRYEGIHLEAICCSDLERSYETAAIAFRQRTIPIVRDARLRECDYGELTGATADHISQIRLQYVEHPFPGGESLKDVVARTNDFLRNEGRRPILIIGHRATWYSLEFLYRGKALDEVVAAPWVWQPGWKYATSS